MTSRHPQLLAPQVSSVHGAHGLSRPPPAALDFTSFSQGVCVRPKASIQLPHLLSSDPRIQAESRVGAPPAPPPGVLRLPGAWCPASLGVSCSAIHGVTSAALHFTNMGTAHQGQTQRQARDVEMIQTRVCPPGRQVLRGRETSKHTFTVPCGQSRMG